MRRMFILPAVAALVAFAIPAFAQKAGGTLRVGHRDNPPSASIHEEATISTVMPFMSVYNNLVVFDPKADQNRMTVEIVASSWIEALGGLSRWEIFRVPPCFWAKAGAVANTNATRVPAANATRERIKCSSQGRTALVGGTVLPRGREASITSATAKP